MRFTYKQKLIIFPILTLLLGIIIYKYTIKKTLDLKTQIQVLDKNISLLDNATFKINALKKNIKEINNSLGNYSLSETHTHKRVFSHINNYCIKHGLTIKRFPEIHKFNAHNYRTHTNEIEIKGNFKGLLKLQYQIENNFNIGKLSSVQYIKTKDNKTNTYSLTANFIIQNFTKNN